MVFEFLGKMSLILDRFPYAVDIVRAPSIDVFRRTQILIHSGKASQELGAKRVTSSQVSVSMIPLIE